MIGRIGGGVIVLLALLTQRSPAQTLRVRVLEAGTNQIIPGALVTIATDKGLVLRRALTDDRGRLSFDLGSGGQYRLIVARIGHKSLTLDGIRVDAGTVVDLDAPMPEAPIMLPDLVVEVESSKQCGPDGQGRAASGALWSEISKALWTFELGDARPPNLESSTYQKRLNRAGEVVHATATDWRPAERRPFASPPPDRLLRDGFVTTSALGREYHGPDAALLLSEAFARHYCFSVRPSPDSALIGLAFRPAGRPANVGVVGTLWVERRSAALRSLDFGYTNVTGLPRQDAVGGQLIFAQLAGEWIISSWRIVAPFLISIPGKDYRTGHRITRDSVAGYVERGGEARLAGTQPASGLTIEGVVWDSVAQQPLTQARVSVANGTFTAETDDKGQYRLHLSAAGIYAMTVEHPVLRRYGIETLRTSARAERNQSSRADVATPTAQRLMADHCPRHADPSTQLLLVDLSARWAETVELSWNGAGVGGDWSRYAVTEDGVWMVAEVGNRAMAAFCGVPGSGPVLVRARVQGRATASTAHSAPSSQVSVISLPDPTGN